MRRPRVLRATSGPRPNLRSVSDMGRARARRESANAEIEAARGRFLANMIDAEAHLDQAIVYFFAPDEYRLFIETMLDRLNLVAKISALRKILRFLGMHEERSALVKEFDGLRQVRNAFAHQAFELVGNSFMTEGADFELYRKERLDLGPRVEDI